jgi:hypothetical protein
LSTKEPITKRGSLTWVVGGFHDTCSVSESSTTTSEGHTEEESSKEETHKVFGKTSGDGDDGPSQHDTDEEGGDLDSGDEHVGRDTSDDVSDKEDRDTGLVLDVGQTEVVFQ